MVDINPRAEADKLHRLACACRLLADETRWRLVKWWYKRKAWNYDRTAYEWIGMEATWERKVADAFNASKPSKVLP